MTQNKTEGKHTMTKDGVEYQIDEAMHFDKHSEDFRKLFDDLAEGERSIDFTEGTVHKLSTGRILVL